MHVKLNPHRLFFLAMLASPFLGYIFSSGLLASIPIVLGAGLVVINEIICCRGVNKKHALIILFWFPYVAWASLNYLRNPFEDNYLSSYFLTILLLPVMVLASIKLFVSENSHSNYVFIYKVLFVFLLLQLIVCFGQFSTYYFGVGFPVNEIYAHQGMISGTFFNSNDLGAAIVLVAFIAIGFEKFILKSNCYVLWLVIAVLLVVSGSRSAMLLGVLLFCFNKIRTLKEFLGFFFLFSFAGLFFSFFLFEVESNAVHRFLQRIESLLMVLSSGIQADNSMSIRLSSYVHFIGQLPELGFGSGVINNYFKYSDDANFYGAELLFQNPHSLVVEIAYWLGWPGLLLFFVPVMVLLQFSRRKIQLAGVLLVVTMIPSSILGGLVFFMLAIFSFFDFDKHSGG